MQQASTEIDKLATLCSALSLQTEPSCIGKNLLEPISGALGADSAAFRCFALDAPLPRIKSLSSIGVPATVTEVYLKHFYAFDPVLSLLRQPSLPGIYGNRPAHVAADTTFQRYHHEFLVPNGLVHHVGFLLQDKQQRCAWLFNFHRPAAASAFGELELARARLICTYLQGQASAAALTSTHRGPQTNKLGALTAREQDVVLALMRGLANKQIATSLDISTRTVENHLRTIYAKLDLGTRTQLLALLHQQDYSADKGIH